jgi:hypothetical protein
MLGALFFGLHIFSQGRRELTMLIEYLVPSSLRGLTIPHKSRGIKPCPCYNFGVSAPLDYITIQNPIISVR